jgi:ferritin-like metal-binding protein YciE
MRLAEGTPLHELFVDVLKDLYNAEHQLIKALPRMVKAASTPELRCPFQKHLGELTAIAERMVNAEALHA